MKKDLKRALSAVLAIVMMLGLLIVPAAAVDKTVKFDATTLTIAAADKEELTQAEVDSYFTVTGVTKRGDVGGAATSVEVPKNATGGFQFTVTGTADVAVEFSSTGSSNTSLCGIVKADATTEIVPEDTGKTEVTGAGGGRTVFNYTGLTAGTYLITSPQGEGATDYNRGARVYNITVTETGASDTPAETTAPAETAAPETTAPAETAAPETTAPAETTAPGTDTPVAGGNEWVASLDTVPGKTDGLTEGTLGAPLTEETLVATLDGAKFYVGGGATKKDNSYKFQDNCLMGNADAEAPVGTSISAKNGYVEPLAGTYFKWVVEKDGILTVKGDYNAINDSKAYYVAVNNTVDADATAKVNPTGSKALDVEVILSVKAGDEVIIVGAGTKPMLKSCKFEVMEATTDSWTASLDNVPGKTDGLTEGTLGAPLTEETLVATVGGVKFYVGGGATKKDNSYKFQDNCLMGNADAENPVGTSISAKNGYVEPLAGTYFKWVVEKDGILTVKGDYNAINDSKAYYVAVNNTVDADATAKVNPTGSKALDVEVILSVKAGDEVIIVGAGTKPMLKSFEFKSGGVTEGTADWTKDAIGANVTMTAVDNKAGAITVNVSGVKVGKILEGSAMTTYADDVTAIVTDASGAVVATGSSNTAGASHTIDVEVEASGTYTVKLQANRAGQTPIDFDATATVDYVLPLATPAITALQNLDGGKVKVTWDKVPEAEKYTVTLNGAEAGTATTNTFQLDCSSMIGQEITVTVSATRGTETTTSAEMKTTVTGKFAVAWSTKVWGISVNPDTNNLYEGSLNDGGESVTLEAKNNGGKINDGSSADGLQFYYTTIDDSDNFTLKAHIHLDSWTYSNGQEGFGMLIQDSMPTHVEYGQGKEGGFYTNQYFMGGIRMSYFYDTETQTLGDSVDSGFKKWNARLGFGVRRKLGLTPDNIDLINNGDAATLNLWTRTDETTMANGGPSSKAFVVSGAQAGESKSNVLGNCTNEGGPGQLTGTLYGAEYTTVNRLVDFDLEVERNNTGYILRYYDKDGNLVGEDINYNSRDSLSQLDPDHIYAGFFVARNAKITVSNVSLETRDPSEDPAPLVKPATKVSANFSVNSPTTSNTEDFTLDMIATVDGTVSILQNNTKVADVDMKANETVNYPVTLKGEGSGRNSFKFTFTPDPSQFDAWNAEHPDDKKVLGSTEDILAELLVTYRIRWSDMKNLYVSPNGGAGGQGTKKSPINMETAVAVARPGQTIVVMQGTYNFRSSVKINKGMDGTADQPIRMIADPEATSRPVLDFTHVGSGLVIGGDYWYVYGIDVVNSTSAGVSVGGNNNVIEQVHTYNNYSAGISLERYDGNCLTIDTWPTNNLIKNCTSWNNADARHEDADGFTAKLTCGEGNVFDGCIAHHNADDGWDMFAKSDTGVIGNTKLYNCVAYKNGYLFDWTTGEEFVSSGNGNGFKMGGNSMPGAHELHNSYSFYNKSKGIDSNSGLNIGIYDSISYNNGLDTREVENWNAYNVALYTSGTAATDYTAQNIISFKDNNVNELKVDKAQAEDSLPQADQLSGQGTQDTAKMRNETTYYWDGSKSVNTAGATITADMFKSLEFVNCDQYNEGGTVARDENGNLDLGDFLQLNDKAPADVGPDEVTTEKTEPPTVEEETGAPIGGTTGAGGGGAPSRDSDRGETTTPPSDQPTTPPSSTTYTDVEAGSWYEAGVSFVTEKGLFQGMGNGTFAPNSNMTRAMLMTVLARLAGESTDGGATWYSKAMDWAVAQGISDGTMPDGNITREQLVTMLYRYSNSPEVDAAMGMAGYVDVASISDWAQTAMRWAVQNGILNGKDGARLDPQGTATRAEVATLLARFVGEEQ